MRPACEADLAAPPPAAPGERAALRLRSSLHLLVPSSVHAGMGGPGMGGAPGGMPGMPTNPQEQMAALRELVDSGQLTDDDKREIKKMFAESLGGGDVDEKIREANKNRDQLDAQAREALDLLNKLMV